MSNGDTPLITWLRKVQREKGVLPSQMAVGLGISHATVSRWMHGKDIPKAKTCCLLSDYSGEPVDRILFLAGHITERAPDTQLPPLREYLARKYPGAKELDLLEIFIQGIERA